MSCPIDQFGKPICLIVDHPDGHEKFCVHCKQRFVERDSEWLWLLIIALIILVLLLSGCEQQANRLLICIADTSASAVNNSERSQLGKGACYSNSQRFLK